VVRDDDGTLPKPVMRERVRTTFPPDDEVETNSKTVRRTAKKDLRPAVLDRHRGSGRDG